MMPKQQQGTGFDLWHWLKKGWGRKAVYISFTGSTKSHSDLFWKEGF
jgi:hypothetical protein